MAQVVISIHLSPWNSKKERLGLPNKFQFSRLLGFF